MYQTVTKGVLVLCVILIYTGVGYGQEPFTIMDECFIDRAIPSGKPSYAGLEGREGKLLVDVAPNMEEPYK